MCSCHQSLEKALEACTIPRGEGPEEVFLRDILSEGGAPFLVYYKGARARP
ncbi:MAG: hypothetical protein RDV48_16600 [Candidatus Eremiobacteraeota bacterium]|nr:hypothetical protein [Candidatus Eremiobacteraeota bacterium]